MSAIGEKQRLAICYGYILVAVAQLSLVIVASTLHNDTTPYAKAAYESSQRATRTTSGLAFLLLVVQVYLSAIITLLGCPIIFIGWFVIAQIVSTVYFCYIPFKYPKSVAPPVEDEWFLADQDDLELRILSYKMDPASLNN
ncbi:hypothetical protein FPRO06_08344 [Fusarium proliferatum]|uniref:Uncharacterized protein n=1 Tax=Fusarium proliferatum (strain ET1) TaxID=1227346 RepID=A0A1L7VP03_FUSPR|nr:uncharacterized protein FPRO_09506 [Fusarium proliferatum ET1]KAG4258313.1 hypothetical protein FPRO03_03267 [Fusarium proliferatum]KAI1050345.1 hypothetical protein LB506_001543 [Fusarium annulatum]KAG4270953.1 hypothetical protein FPRO04_02934 [Fusarium proliferatum]KAG4283965.1 hypothetical protein FPRO06_08344 [Fusarium proliferatum]CVL00192.1 uncharacterized protein FPRN_09180 [Fusarium proliferatum]